MSEHQGSSDLSSSVKSAWSRCFARGTRGTRSRS